MPIPHALNIYQKPKQGTKFIRRYRIINYKQSISAQGWFDTAVADVMLRDVQEAQQFCLDYIANRVAVIIDDPITPAWEGFINRITANNGVKAFTISLDEMGNRITVKYTDGTTPSTPVPTPTAVAENLTSQAIYGIKQAEMEFGYVRNGASAMATLRDSLLVNRSYPQSSVKEGNGFLVRIEMLGFYHTLKWETYTSAASGAAPTISTFINTLLTNVDNGSTFFDKTDTSQITASAITFPAQQRNGSTIWDLFQQLAEIGDASDGYIVGITPTNWNTGKRRLYYRKINKVINYHVNMFERLRVRTRNRQAVQPWRVVPDNGVRIDDWQIAYNLPGDDPRFTYIYGVDYDGNSQSVTYNGQDDRRLQGIFDLGRAFQRFGRGFGARMRVSDG